MSAPLPYSKDAYKLLHDGSIALAEIESNGMAVDVPYLEKQLARARRKKERYAEEFKDTTIGKSWQKHFKTKTNFNSPDQLTTMLFDELGYKSTKKTEKGKDAVDEEALRALDSDSIPSFISMRQMQKVAKSIEGIQREIVNGYIHCFFTLHKVVSYRSASEDFNFQNIPVRDAMVAKMLRRGFIARKGNQLVEIDFSGAEVRVSACYHKDPNMIDYILNPAKDMHRDMAMECYKLEAEQITKQIRHCGKNQFVFPQFYGDWFLDCGTYLWNSVPSLVLPDGTPLKDHLKQVGLKKLGKMDERSHPDAGSFLAHIQKVENKFWGEYFPDYDAWKDEWVKLYHSQGWVLSHTGFIYQAMMSRNQVINYPVQGSSFHALLMTIILLMREMRKRKMKSKIVGQIHDSIVADIAPSERDEYIALAFDIINNKLRKLWKWLIIPMEAEVEVAPVGGTWYDKKKIEIEIFN